ncbi:MAG: glycosyltransferase family 4 protein [Candidatus Methanomethylophilaceae archaeon]
MRIVDVNPFFFPYMGGIERRINDTSRLLAARGHDVTVLTGQLPGTEMRERSPEGYDIIRLKSRFINVYNPPYISSSDILETLESLDADIVNYNYRWAPSYNRDLAAYRGKKVFTYHNMWGEGIGLQAKVSEMNDNRFRRCLNTFDHVICVSNYVRNDLIRRGLDPAMLTTVPTCLDSLPDIGRKEDDFILSLGRLVKTKGLDYLIEAMRDVDCRLIICGKGPESKHLAKLIRKNGLEGKIEMRGYVSEEEKTALMSTCKFFVMPSLFESLGLAAIELMSYGRPLICSDVNGLPETVGDGGVVVPPKDAGALSDAINSLLSDDERRTSLGDSARRRAESYNWDVEIPKIEKVYEDVLNR